MTGARRRAASKMMHSSVVAGVMIVVTSCGGGDAATPAVSTPESPESVESTADSPFAFYREGPIAEAAAVIDREHGDVDGFAVTVVALDSGYSVSQIVANPSIDADGRIAGLDPDGAPLGLVESDGEAHGFRATPPQPKRPTDRVLLLFDLTLDDVHEEATNQLQAQLERDFEAWKAEAQAERAAAESEAEEVRLAAVVLLLIAQGYTLEDAMQGIFFGEYEVSGGAPCARLTTPPTGPKLTGASLDCGLGFPETSTAQVADERTEPEAAEDNTRPDSGELDPDRPRGVYQGTLVDDIAAQLGADSSSTLSNLVSVDFDGDVPELALLWVAQLTGSYDISPDVICVIEARIEIERAPLVGATFVNGQWSGEARFSIGSFDGTCAPGSQENQPETGPITVTVTASDTTLTGALSGDGSTLSFTGTAVP